MKWILKNRPCKRSGAPVSGPGGNDGKAHGPLIRWIGVMVAMLCAAAGAPGVRADNIRPAYLEIEELASGNLRIAWKVPLGQQIPADFKPSFPAVYRRIPPQTRLETRDAIVEKWYMAGSGESLAGKEVRIDGLKQTTMDALARIKLADGAIHRVVLRPTRTAAVIPLAGQVAADRSGVLIPLLDTVGRWRYPLVFLAAFGLSLTPRSRRRGIVLCTMALLGGVLAGQALGRLPLVETAFSRSTPSQTETAKILQGLLLNTYRAFMLEQDEDIYDTLSRSVSGDFLNTLYLKNREGMVMRDAQGAVALVRRLDVRSIESLRRTASGNIEFVANWDVYGSVHHTNHVHYRCNAYSAEVSMAPATDYWKLVRIQLLNEQRVM